MTFEELVAKSLEHASSAEELVEHPGGPSTRDEAAAAAQIHAALAESYARLASAVIVNRTSMHAVVETSGRRVQ